MDGDALVVQLGPATPNDGTRSDGGQVTVATHVYSPAGVVACPSAPMLAGALRASGVPVATGPVTTELTPHQLGVAKGSDARPLAAVGIPVDAGRATLAVVHDALAQWRAAIGARTLLLAGPRSFCAGVERAIEVVERLLATRPHPVYVRNQIVHNSHIVHDLQRRGAVFVTDLNEIPDGATVVFSAHGVSPAVRDDARRRRLRVVDATCPLVTKVHNEARRYAERGDTVVLIGHAGHEETEGTLGEAPHRTVLVQSAAEAATIDVTDAQRVSYVTQTTLAVDETADVVAALRQRFPELRGPAAADICYATTNRQDALQAVAARSDLVLVIGSTNSSNSMRLVELAQRQGVPARLIEDADHLDLNWLAGIATLGVTAGASAPPSLVDGVIAALRGLGPVTVHERTLTTETLQFALPGEVR